MTTGVPITLYVAGSTLIDAAAAGIVLFGGRKTGPAGRTVGLGRLGLAALAILVMFAVKGPFLRALRVGAFGLIHLVYVDLVVLLPALGAMLWLAAMPGVGGRPWVRLTPLARLAATALLAPAAVGIYATWIEPFRLRVESARLDVSGRRAGRSAVRVGVISDIQTDRVTDHERRAVDVLMAQRPDVILIPGDVFQGTTAEFEADRAALRDLFGRLSAPGGVYLALGDVDSRGDHLRDILDEAGIRLLVDEAVTIAVGDRQMTIGGVALNFLGSASRGLVERLETAEGEEDIRILLAHRPDVVLGLRPGSRVDLVVAGHTHGGQVVIPGFGPPITLSRVPRAVAAGGLHRVDGNAIYVSRGVGHERDQAPRVRFLCPPEVAVIEIGSRPSGAADEVGHDAGRDRDRQRGGAPVRPSSRSGQGDASRPDPALMRGHAEIEE
jgi:predicted MPP superfamily phosphohydrolase